MTAQVPVSTTTNPSMLKRTYSEKKDNPKRAGQAKALRRY